MNSFGKNTLIACAVATVLGTGTAFAVAPTVTPDYVLYAAGGSAQANAFFVAAAKLLTNVDSYTDAAAGTDSGSYRVLYGTTAAAVGTIPQGKNVLYFYKFNGGSYSNGIAPQVGSGSSLLYPTVASVLAGQSLISGRSAFQSGSDGKPDYIYNDTNTLTNSQVPDWGVADVEVSLFSGFNNPTGNAGGANQNTNGGNAPTTGASSGIYDNLFGIAVTSNLYAKKTNFTRAEVEGILTGNISDWSQLFDDTGAQLAAGGIVFLDRGEGSGTKASGNQYFLGYPGTSAPVLPYSALNPYSGTSLTGADPTFVETSLDIAESSTTNVVNDLLLAQSKGIRAIAVLGLENPPVEHQVSGANQYAFTKINGTAVDTANGSTDDINGTSTSYINVVKGNYDFYYQNSFNTRAGTLGGSTPGDQFAKAFQTTFTAASFVGADSGLKFPGGVPGTLLDADTQGSLVKGGTIATRNKISPAPLQQKFVATSGGIPASKESL